MADRIIKLKIDVTKIDKKLLYTGAKGTYLDATLFLKDGVDAYGNCGMISQDVSKEDRLKGIKGPILGNAKDLPGKTPTSTPAAIVPQQEEDSELPF